MANHKSSIKRIRRNQRREEINKSNVTKIRTFIKKVEAAAAAGDKEAAQDAFKTATSLLSKGVHKNLLHKNTAARKTSRLAKRIKAIG